jgi:hypothetical protein
MNFSDVNGIDETINVLPANGTAASIINWASQCRLDSHQRRAFEIITGYYILSYIYTITDLQQHDNDSIIINHNRCQLETLVERNRINSDQLICFLHGPGGSGKTTVISLLQMYSKQFHFEHESDSYNRSIVLTAMTGVAATVIGGETVHSALYLNNKLEYMSHDKLELWHNTKLIVIDEISFASNENINSIHINLGKLKEKMLQPFGGVHVIYIVETLDNLSLLLVTLFTKTINKYHHCSKFILIVTLNFMGIIDLLKILSGENCYLGLEMENQLLTI